jgi:hypothetical protein
LGPNRHSASPLTVSARPPMFCQCMDFWSLRVWTRTSCCHGALTVGPDSNRRIYSQIVEYILRRSDRPTIGTPVRISHSRFLPFVSATDLGRVTSAFVSATDLGRGHSRKILLGPKLAPFCSDLTCQVGAFDMSTVAIFFRDRRSAVVIFLGIARKPRSEFL